MKPTKCESDQIIEAFTLWFARSGGIVDIKIKKIEMSHEHEELNSVMPQGFSKHNPKRKGGLNPKLKVKI